MSVSLTLSQANQIIENAIAQARQLNLPKLTVVVLDQAGNLKAAQREDGASMSRFDIASGKAWACVSMGATSRVLWERAQGNPIFFNALSAAHQGKFIPQTGGVPIYNAQGEMIGAVGASGATGDEDEQACIAGVLASGLQYQL